MKDHSPSPLSLLVALAGLLCLVPCALKAQVTQPLLPWQGFSTTSVSFTNPADGIVNYCVGSAYSANGAAPVVRFLSATGNNAANKITVYTVTNQYAVTTNYWPTLTNLQTFVDASGLASNSLLVVRHKASDTYERARVYGTSTTNISVQAALLGNTAAGDTVYAVTPSASIPVGNATITYYGGALIYGTPQDPLLVELSGTNATINLMSGNYVP